MHQDKWDNTFLEISLAVSKLSKDSSSKVGSCIVTPDKKHISIGYNGMVSGIEETPEMWSNRQIKLLHVLHSEENNLLNCPFSPKDCTIYITHQPCSRCIIKLAQVKIKRIVYINKYERLENIDVWNYYAKLFDEIVQKQIL